jgi:hypothetical protein
MAVGTYMSAYIEVDHGDRSPPFSDPVKVHSLTEGSFAFRKDYEVFDALAGGRDAAMAPEDRDLGRAPLFSPRGIPSPCSPAVGWDYFKLIADPPNLPDPYFWPAWRVVSSLQAGEWLRNKGCHEADFFQWFNCEPEGRVWRVVSVPGHYNASYLRLDEFDAALRHHGLMLVALPVEYRIIRAALAQLVDQHGSERVRLVVWFS